MGQPADGDGGSAPAAGNRPRGRRRTYIRALVAVLVLAGAAVFLLERLEGSASQVGTTFDRLHWHWLLVSVAAEAGSIAALSWLQRTLLRVDAVPVRVRDLLPVTMASNAVAQSLPAGTLFAEGYAFRQYQRLGARRAVSLWAELSAGALAAAALAAVAVAGAVVVGSGLRNQILPGLALILAGALVAAALFRQVPLLREFLVGVLARAERRLPERLCRPLRAADSATRQMEGFRPSLRLWVACFAAAALNWGMDAVVLTMAMLTVGGPVPWRGLLLCYAAAQLLVELPVTPGGLGLVEGGLVEVLSRFGVPVSRATAATLIYRVVSYWFLVLVGWLAVGWLAWRHRCAAQGPAARSWPAPGPASTGLGGDR